MPDGPVLVVGASGILAPAVRALVAQGRDVVALARPSQRLTALTQLGPSGTGGRVRPVAVDLHDEPAVVRSLHGLAPCAAGLLYCPTAAPSVVRRLADVVAGRVVVLATSAVAGPDGPGAAGAPGLARDGGRRPAEVRLLLGWHLEDDGTRWHTPEEVSGRALEVLAAPGERDAVLGTVQPWSQRPG